MAESSAIKDKDIDLDWLIDMLIPVMDGARQRRKFIENEWLLNYRAWQGWPTTDYLIPLPDGTIHYFLPWARKAIEKRVEREAQLLLPNRDWHQTLPRNANIPYEVAQAVHEVMSYICSEKISVLDNVKIGLRCLEMYNFTVQNTSPIIVNSEVWPYQEAIDPFNFYVYPDTARNTQQALMLWEDCIVPYQVYDSYVDEESKTSIYKKLYASDLAMPIWPYHLVERLSYRGLTTPNDFIQGSSSTLTLTETQRQRAIKNTEDSLAKQSRQFVALSKIYFRLGSIWYYCVICTNMKGSGSNRYNAKIVALDHEDIYPLYHWTNTRLLPGELYTNGTMDDMRVAQNLTNNSLSDVEANRSVFAEPPIVMDSNTITRTEGKTFANRKVWYTDGNPNESIMPLQVNDTSTNGYRAWQAYREIIEDSAGGGITEGMPGRNMPRAGGAANNLMNMALTGVTDVAKTYETNILTPGLSDIFYIVQNFVPSKQLISIPNKNPNLVKSYTKSDLYGTYSFIWLGAQAFQDVQDRAEKFNQFFQWLFNPQTFPLIQQQLAAQELKIDLVNVLKMYYTYGLGEKGLGDIIVAMSEQDKQAANKPTPEQQAAEAQQKATEAQTQQKQQEFQMKQQHEQTKLQVVQQKGQIDVQAKQAELQAKLQELEIDKQKALLELQTLQAKMHLDMRASQAQHQAKILSIHGDNLATKSKIDQQEGKSKIADMKLKDQLQAAKQRKVSSGNSKK